MANAMLYSGSNTYVPSLEATGNLVVNFSRNPNAFPVNQYMSIRGVDKDVGLYNVINPDEAARIVTPNDYVWNDGNDAPQGVVNAEEFNFLGYRTVRKAYPFAVGWKALQQASWEILASYASIQASKCMTDRTQIVQTALAAGITQTSTATSLSGGQWSAATTSNPYIKESLFAAAEVIMKATNSAVAPKDLVLVVNPDLAKVMAATDEIQNYVKSSPDAYRFLSGVEFIANWGLPSHIWGFPVVIEDTIVVTSYKGATRAASFVQSNTVAYLISRKEGLSAGFGTSPSFSTATLFYYNDEMTVESMDDPNNRRIHGRVVQDITAVVTAPQAGYYITACQ